MVSSPAIDPTISLNLMASKAAATAIAQVVGAVIPIVYFTRPNESLLRLGKCRFDGKALLRTCTNGASELMSNLSMSLVGMLYNLQLIKYAGEDGIAALRGLIKAYMKRGGISIQFNIFSPETLRDAQEHPERYRNLQVRVCGWNVLWNNLSRAEQDAYILRAENILC